MKAYCEKFPQLYVRDIGVRFNGGVAEVKDAATAKKLAEIKDFGILVEAFPDVEKPFNKMTTAELEAAAEELGADISGAKTNAERAAILEQAAADKETDPGGDA